MFESVWVWMVLGMSQVTQLPALAPVFAHAQRHCGADAMEPNDVRRRAKQAKGGKAEGRTCGADVDWFWMEIPRGRRVEVVVHHAVGLTFRSPTVFPPRARKPRGRRGKRPGETFTRYRARKGGRHRVRVEGDGEHGRSYRLELRLL